MLRRLEKRILVDLPTTEARCAMFTHHLPAVICTTDSNGFELTSDLDYDTLAQVMHEWIHWLARCVIRPRWKLWIASPNGECSLLPKYISWVDSLDHGQKGWNSRWHPQSCLNLHGGHGPARLMGRHGEGSQPLRGWCRGLFYQQFQQCTVRLDEFKCTH